MANNPMPKIITATEASNKFGRLIDEASRGLSMFVITRLGRASAVIIGMEQYKKLMEDQEIAQEQADPEFQALLAEAKEDIELGRTMNQKEFDEKYGFTPEMLSEENADNA